MFKNKKFTIEIDVLNSDDIVREIKSAKSIDDAKESLKKLQVKVTPKKYSDTKDRK